MNNGGNARIDGTLNTTSAVAINTNGTLSGSGNIAGPVTASSFGRIVPGQLGTPGTLTITGTLNLNSGTLLADIGGTTPGTQHDKLVVTGNATLTGGTFTSVLSGSFVPAAFDAFNMLSISGTRTGDFSFEKPARRSRQVLHVRACRPELHAHGQHDDGEYLDRAGWHAGMDDGRQLERRCPECLARRCHSLHRRRIDHHRFRIGTGQQRDFCGNGAVHQRHVHDQRLLQFCPRPQSHLGATLAANGVLDVHGNSTLSGGTISAGGGAFANAADGTVTISSSLTLNGTLTNAGTFTQTTGQLLVNNPFGRFLNQPGGIYNQQSTVNPSMTGSGYFLNSGTFAKFGAGTTGISTPFFNQTGGVVQVQGGILDLTGLGNGGTTHQGNFDVASGALARWNNGRTNFASGASFSGAGAVQFASGTINVYADASATNVQLSGATLNVTPVTKTFTWTGANSTISSGNISGWGLVNNTGTLGITGGTLSATFSNQGTVNWTAGNVAGTGPFLNQSGATVNATMAVTATFSPQFDNRSGAVVTRLGNQNATFSGTFTNSGTVIVSAGTLNLSGGGSHSGSFQGSGSGTLQFGGGAHTLDAASSISTSNVRFIQGSIVVNGATTSQH